MNTHSCLHIYDLINTSSYRKYILCLFGIMHFGLLMIQQCGCSSPVFFEVCKMPICFTFDCLSLSECAVIIDDLMYNDQRTNVSNIETYESV